MTSTSEVCDKLGRKRMADSLGVGVTTISNAAVSGAFPAKWYVVMQEMCRAEGVECPDDLFNFIRPAPTEPLKEAS
ncbi:hypothetical protein T7987_07835 [Sulfitobacter faviae]|uniref:Transcriptional regulator n=1 Tax=Sulfitobacter faviae TaxID=1775881 RepID=A0ABZ0V5I3_9RHOB|nr:hypothetical protein [Sulfitobacter faviae]WPZ23130.1 hypothetical protein T7987_07835 [Sulfitobacter faviae]